MLSAMLALTACGANGNAQEGPTPQPSPAVQQTPEQIVQQSSNDSVYARHYFDSLGFSIELPTFWEGKFGLYEFEVEFDFGTRHFVEIYHIATREELGGEGRLVTLGRSPRDHYTYEDERPVMAGTSIFLAQTGGITYFANFPSGVEHSDGNSAAEYLEMIGHWEPSHWDFLTSSFQLMEASVRTPDSEAFPFQLSILLTPESVVTIETNRRLYDFAWVRLDHDFIDGELYFIPSDERIGASCGIIAK